MWKRLIPLAMLAGTLGLASVVQAQSYPNHIYNFTSAPDKCLGVKENDLSHPFMAKCAGYPAENWAVSPPNNHGFVRIQSQRTGPSMCLGVAAADTSAVKMASCASVKNQQWTLTPTDQPDTYTVTSQLLGPGVCLGIRANTDNAELDMNSCHNYPGQLWIIHQ
jgi:hypothetical protein